jgi:hypothetical protein
MTHKARRLDRGEIEPSSTTTSRLCVGGVDANKATHPIYSGQEGIASPKTQKPPPFGEGCVKP